MAGDDINSGFLRFSIVSFSNGSFCKVILKYYLGAHISADAFTFAAIPAAQDVLVTDLGAAQRYQNGVQK
jgi:hypothetical protein